MEDGTLVLADRDQYMDIAAVQANKILQTSKTGYGDNDLLVSETFREPS